MYEVLRFHLALGGTSTAFRFKDYTDYKSSAINADVAPTDQPLVLEAGSPGGYQLWKEYTFGALTHSRRIFRVIGSTFRVANEVGAEQDASRWTLDEARGILTPGGTFAGVPTTWGGEFEIKARFAQDPEFEVTNHRIQRVDVQIVEKREADE